MLLNHANWILLTVLLSSLFTLVPYLIDVVKAARQLPRITVPQVEIFSKTESSKISVIIPAFNEEANIEDCIKSVVFSTQLSAAQLEIWIIDDQSTDRTPEILHSLQTQLADPRLNILTGRPRPTEQFWTGKNWACQQGAEVASGDFLLFIDADVRLKPHAILAAVQTAIAQSLDFLTCIPTVVCGSLVEWLVQPLMFINLMISFNFGGVKDPTTKTTYALGPFLLFRRSAYDAIGMHKAVAECAAEDVALARRIKHKGFKLRHYLGDNLASLRMYRNWSALWEGWTKILYVGSQRSVPLMLLLVIVMLLVYTIPWIGFAIAIAQASQRPLLASWIGVGIAGLAILVQYQIRQQGSSALGTSTKYWWLQGIGGLLISVFAIASIIKAETGWGWTWRGRKLQLIKK
ncbi:MULTISPECIES: glycosyltransferase [Leptolyngbya]|uniref:glycosyltransferase n=1 Tax=Leptolyngbya TaxID=47251 RepID=UPI001683160E|nr:MULTISPECIES: glycosyltransferase family 2 protein [unclassified Leptolyngbya]MBD1856102.1 glycosyltransferase [Leptolyngbya sp. FACHB-1624]MCY6490331.1 glycosyltransferase family 2 protein [Leptolyngbya sp. GGD]